MSWACHVLRRCHVLYDAPLPIFWGKSSNGENDYYQNIWTCFNKSPVNRLHVS